MRLFFDNDLFGNTVIMLWLDHKETKRYRHHGDNDNVEKEFLTTMEALADAHKTDAHMFDNKGIKIKTVLYMEKNEQNRTES